MNGSAMSNDPLTVRVAVSDLNGVMRGKRVPASYASKLGKGAIQLPLSVINVDVTGSSRGRMGQRHVRVRWGR